MWKTTPGLVQLVLFQRENEKFKEKTPSASPLGLPGLGTFLGKGSPKEVAAGKLKGTCGMAKPAAPGGFQVAVFGFGVLFGCAVCAPGSPGWIWREQGRDGVRSQEPLWKGEHPGDGAGPAVMQLLLFFRKFSLCSPPLEPQPGGSLLHECVPEGKGMAAVGTFPL